jgi:hypothetical protein
MENKLVNELSITFTENPEQEVLRLGNELKLKNIVEQLNSGKALSETFKEDIKDLLWIITDLFTTSLPILDSSPEETLRKASRDVNLSRLLRERGMARLYLLSQSKKTIEVYDEQNQLVQNIKVNVFQTIKDPYSGDPFKTQQDFLAWFCKDAKVSRALVFIRFGTYLKLTTALGYTLEEAFNIIITKPTVIKDALEGIGQWEKGRLLGINPDIAKNLVHNILPVGDELREQIECLADDVIDAHNRGDEEEEYRLADELANMSVPAIRKLIEELATHESVRDATKLVKNDILKSPEIGYWWDDYLVGIKVELIVKGVDENGTERINDIYTVTLLPDSKEKLPEEIVKDLSKRLSIRNSLD